MSKPQIKTESKSKKENKSKPESRLKQKVKTPEDIHVKSLRKGSEALYVLKLEERNSTAQQQSLLETLLKNRGVSNEKDREIFLNPNYSAHTHDPHLLKNIRHAGQRIIDAITKKEKIVIYGDYDADGIPASLILYSFFKKIGYTNFSNYIPHRHDEGFGVHKDALEKFHASGAGLVITVDCGIADIEPIKYAQKIGLDVIVTDHHLPGAELPPAYAIVNPKLPGCEYPEKMLCGSAVAYKLVQVLLSMGNFSYTTQNVERSGEKSAEQVPIPSGWEKWLLDMVGIATVSDMVPLVGENRVLAKFGIHVLRKTRRIGLLTLLSKVGITASQITEEDIGFTLSPRINAASRMGTPMDAFLLLATEDEAEAVALTDHLIKLNDRRKKEVAEIMTALRTEMREKYLGAGQPIPKIIFAGHPTWSPGVLGLVANACAEEFGRPCFVWGAGEGVAETSDLAGMASEVEQSNESEHVASGGIAKGSCRGIDMVNVVELMNACPAGTFVKHGGHANSGGFSVNMKHVSQVSETLNKVAETLIYGRTSGYTEVDAELTLDDVNGEVHEVIEKLAPYGMSNPKPLFLFKDIIPHSVKAFGKTKNHLEMTFKNSKGQTITAIKFFSAPHHFHESILSGGPVSLVAHIEKSLFFRRPTLRLRIQDIVS